MAELSITVAGRTHRVACRDGEEDKLQAAAALLDERARSIVGLGQSGETRTLLLSGLLLADERIEAIARVDDQSSLHTRDCGSGLVERLARLADRMEAMATSLEEPEVTGA